jgi:SMI1 / KNR4 family (SUKH-1)
MNLPKNNSINLLIRDFEEKTGLLFPIELKHYYLRQNGQKFDSMLFTRMVDSDFQPYNPMEEIMPLEKIVQIYWNHQDDASFTQALPNAKLIPFGEGMGAVICIASSLDPTLHGKIYIFDWDFGATYQAESLEDFLGQLRVFEEIE